MAATEILESLDVAMVAATLLALACRVAQFNVVVRSMRSVESSSADRGGVGAPIAAAIEPGAMPRASHRVTSTVTSRDLPEHSVPVKPHMDGSLRRLTSASVAESGGAVLTESVTHGANRLAFTELPLNVRVQAVVNWLSVISNCLTMFLRPSQVLYSFLNSSCDFMLYTTSLEDVEDDDAYGGEGEATFGGAASAGGAIGASPDLPHVHACCAALVPSEGHQQLAAPRATPCEVDGVSVPIDPVVQLLPAAESTRPVAWPWCLLLDSRPTEGGDTGGAATGCETTESAGRGTRSWRRTVNLWRHRCVSCCFEVLCRCKYQLGLSRVGAATASFAGHCTRLVRRVTLLGASNLSSGGAARDGARRRRASGAAPASPARDGDSAGEANDGDDGDDGRSAGPTWILLNSVLLCSLVIFHIHGLFFFVGNVCGYVAAVGTLFVLGREVGDAWRDARDWIDGSWWRATEAAPLPPDLHPLILRVSSLGTMYVVERVAALASSLCYLSMLFDEGEALYDTHHELMRWYVNTVGLILVDGLQLVRFLLWKHVTGAQRAAVPSPVRLRDFV